MVQLILQERFARCKVHTAVRGLFDATNAFACTRAEDLDKVSKEWFGKDSVYVEDMVKYTNPQVPCADGLYSFHPEDGGLMGHCLAPPMFVADYSSRVGALNLGNSTCPVGRALVCTETITGKATDLSLTTFVDDVAKNSCRRKG